MKVKIFIYILFFFINSFAEDVFNEFKWLNDSYGFIEEYDTRSAPIIGKRAGCYPIGNGFVFGSLGIYNPINTIDFICGPVYDAPFFGQEKVDFFVNNEKIKFFKQSIRWVKDADIVVSNLVNDKVSFETIDFVPPQVKSLVRIFIIRNISNEDLNNIKVVFKYPNLRFKSIEVLNSTEDLFLKQNNGNNFKFYRIGFVNQPDEFDLSIRDEISFYLNLKSKESISNIRYLAIDTNEKNLEETVQLVKTQNKSLLAKTKEWWTNWLKGTVKIESSDEKVSYLLETQKMILKCQQSHTGGFSPMNGYSYTWIRDNNGPVLYMLRIGKFKEAKDVLDFYYNYALKTGFVASSSRVDVSFLEKESSNIDWSKMGVDIAEVPSWLVKQHWWYYTYTGDLGLLKSRFPYLKRCLMGQKITKDGKLYFQTDETYMWTLQSRTYNLVKYPNYYLGLNSYSVDSAFEWVAACENLATVAKLTGDDKEYEELMKKSNFVRESINKYFWLEKEEYFAPALSIFNQPYYVPHANVGLNPIWVGYSNEDERVKKSLDTHLKYLLKDNFMMKTTPNIEIFTGMIPGMLLYNLTFLSSPLAEKAYESLIKCASPSGDFFELYDGKGECWVVPSWGDGCYGRVRPWEGGINTDSLLFYLSGFLPDGSDEVKIKPNLPSSMKYFRLKDIKFKDLKFDLYVREERSDYIKRFYEIINTGDKNVRIMLDITIPNSKIISLNIDGDESPLDNLKISKELQPNGAFKVDISYEKLDNKETKITHKVFKLPINYYPKSDIVLLTVKDRNMYYSLANEKKVVAIDAELPLTVSDINNAIYDDKNKVIKTKMLIFGPKVFSIGPINWKSYDFWYSDEMSKVFKKYMEGGGIILVMSGATNGREGYEIRPKWLIKLLNGGVWSISKKSGKIVPSDDYTETTLTKVEIDSIRMGEEANEKKHNVKIYKQVDGKGIVLANSTLNGRRWKGFYECEVNTEVGFQHTVVVTAPSNSNYKELNLEVKKDRSFVNMGLVDKKVSKELVELSFNIPVQYITNKKTIIRLSSKKPQIVMSTDSMRVYKLKVVGKSPLAELIGFKQNQIVGICYNTLTYNNMVAPLRIVGNKNYAGLVMKDVGNGIFIKTQLSYSNIKNMINTLLNNEIRAKVIKYLKKR